MKMKIGVIFGGETVEHEISIISAVSTMTAIDKDKYDIIPIYISKEKEWYTGGLLKDIENYQDLDILKKYAIPVVLYNKKGSFYLQSKKGFKRIITELDLVFPIVHGVNVEDGTIQGCLELVGIPYIGGDLYAGAVGQDKVFMKQIFEVAKIPMTKYLWFFDSDYKQNKDKVITDIKKLAFPLIVKPAKLGSSIGINKVSKESDLEDALEDTFRYDTKIVIEEVVPNLREVNCSVLGNYEYQEASEIEEIISAESFFSYEEKYIRSGKAGQLKGNGKGSANRIIPAKLDDKMKDEVLSLSKKVFRVLNSAGVCRIDFLIDDKTKKIYVNEINTIPGLLSYYLWESVGKNFTTLIDDLIALAIKRYKKRNKLIFSFDTNILGFYSSGLKGAKGKLKFGKFNR